MSRADVRVLSPGEAINLSQEYIVLAIPDDTVELTIMAKIYIDHELHEVESHMDFPDVRAAIRDAQRGYVPDDALFMLMPTAEEKIRNLLERYTHLDEEEEE